MPHAGAEGFEDALARLDAIRDPPASAATPAADTAAATDAAVTAVAPAEVGVVAFPVLRADAVDVTPAR